MFANGSDWSSLVRAISHGCGPIRGGWIFMTDEPRTYCCCQIEQLPKVLRPPAFSTASRGSARLATCSTVGLVAGLTYPLSTELSIDHCVRFASRPSLTDQTQFLVRIPM